MTPSAIKEFTPEHVLAQRLETVAAVFGVEILPIEGADRVHAGNVLMQLIDHVRVSRNSAEIWLVLVAICGAMPLPGSVRALQRKLALMEPFEVVSDMLDLSLDDVIAAGRAAASLQIVTDRALVDVDYTAKHPKFVTGIQRVAQQTAGSWIEQHDAALVAWERGAYRALEAGEKELFRPDSNRTESDTEVAPILVPWGVPLVLFEVPSIEHSRRLAAAADAGAFSVRLVGFDCIPVASGELASAKDREKFGTYLELLKRSDRVAAISETAAAEFRAFGAGLGAQGLTGPEVTACALPTVTPVGEASPTSSPGTAPLVLCVGSLGRRKNQLALVEAAEMLWREGQRFRLALYGSGDKPPTVLAALIAELRRSGRPIAVRRGVSNAELAAAYASARCVALLSLHEGFGLPVAEALSHEVPVVTSNFGSLRDIAEGAGGLLVDPEDVFAVADALRMLLTDDDLHARLVDEASERPRRTWLDYARELWDVLVA